jgi:site-specific DNA-cytosine methylase
MLKVLDIFSGIGGFTLSSGWVGGFNTVAYCEIDKMCREVFIPKFAPGKHVFKDVRKLTGQMVMDLAGQVDVICGGFPCQDISCAGHEKGLAGERSGLWWEYHRLIREIRPTWVFAENVSYLKNRGAHEVFSSLEEIGYQVWSCVVGAEILNASHRRDRTWIIAYNPNARRSPESRMGGSRFADETETLPECNHEVIQTTPILAHTDGKWGGLSREARELSTSPETESIGREVGVLGGFGDCSQAMVAGERSRYLEYLPKPRRTESGTYITDWPSPPGTYPHEWEHPQCIEFPVDGTVDGLPSEVAKAYNQSCLKALGNSIVPEVARYFWEWIRITDETIYGVGHGPQTLDQC